MGASYTQTASQLMHHSPVSRILCLARFVFVSLHANPRPNSQPLYGAGGTLNFKLVGKLRVYFCFVHIIRSGYTVSTKRVSFTFQEFPPFIPCLKYRDGKYAGRSRRRWYMHTVSRGYIRTTLSPCRAVYFGIATPLSAEGEL